MRALNHKVLPDPHDPAQWTVLSIVLDEFGRGGETFRLTSIEQSNLKLIIAVLCGIYNFQLQKAHPKISGIILSIARISSTFDVSYESNPPNTGETSPYFGDPPIPSQTKTEIYEIEADCVLPRIRVIRYTDMLYLQTH